MRWWGRKAAREAVRPQLMRGLAGSIGEAAGVPRSYEAQVREAYLGNPVAQRAVKLVAEGVGSCVVYDRGEEDAAARRPTTTPLRGAVPSVGSTIPRMVKDRPGDDPTRCSGSRRILAASLVTASVLETVATQLLLHGNAFVQILQDDRGEPAELFPLRPERVSVEADAGGNGPHASAPPRHGVTG